MTAPRETDIFRVGDLLNNTYRIEGVLGRGGISEVYRARSEIGGRIVAVKVLNAAYARNEAFVVLMTREEQLRDVRHRAIVRYSECQRTEEGHVFLVMDFVDGVGLDTKLVSGGMPVRDLLTVGAHVAAGLEAAHGSNIVHRDLSPDNIILRGDSPSDPVIIDFGIAKDTTEGAKTIVGGKFAGKVAYAAPEQFRGLTDHRSDIYALGALLLATYRGAEPQISEFPADAIAYKAQPLDTEGVPQPFGRLIDRMCAPDPADRFQSATDLREAFETAHGGITVVQPQPGTTVPPTTAPAPARRSGSAWLLLVLLLVIGGAGAGGWAAWRAGLFYPEVSPYTLSATAANGSPLRVTGHAPTPEAQAQLTAAAARLGGNASLTLARGDHPEDWSSGVIALLDIAARLDPYTLDLRGASGSLTGVAPDQAARETILAALRPDALPPGFDITSDILLPPDFLTEDELAPVLRAQATCGPLAADLPPNGLPEGATLAVSGKIASDADRVAMAPALEDIADGRPVTLDLQEMTKAACLVLNRLVDVPNSPIDIRYTFGLTNQENDTDRFFVGENPVIDLALPPSMTDGMLHLAYVDATGQVTRLLPNPARRDSSIDALREGQIGAARVRVSYPSRSAAGNQLTITVTPEALGTGLLVLLHSDAAILPGPARRGESAQAFAAALDAAKSSPDGSILGVTSRPLIVTRP